MVFTIFASGWMRKRGAGKFVCTPFLRDRSHRGMVLIANDQDGARGVFRHVGRLAAKMLGDAGLGGRADHE